MANRIYVAIALAMLIIVGLTSYYKDIVIARIGPDMTLTGNTLGILVFLLLLAITVGVKIAEMTSPNPDEMTPHD